MENRSQWKMKILTLLMKIKCKTRIQYQIKVILGTKTTKYPENNFKILRLIKNKLQSKQNLMQHHDFRVKIIKETLK